MATVATGPMPGSTPISVPTRQPTSAKPRLTHVPATPKPSAILFTKSTSPLRPDRDRQREAPDEDRHAHGDEHQCRDGDLDDAHVTAGDAADEDQQGRPDDEPEALDRERERDEGERDEHQRAQRRAVLGYLVVRSPHALERDAYAEREQ